MSASFPPIPGFAGPLSLKAFLLEYFELQLTFAAPSPTPLSSSVTAARSIALPPNQSFLVIIYVVLSAPRPGPHTPAAPSALVPAEHAGAISAGFAARPHAVVAPTPFMPCGATRGKRSGTRAAGQASSCSSATAWLLYTNTARRPLTNTLLRHAWWAALAASLGPAAMGFMEMYCAVVVQLEAMAGGLQVLGPPLKHAAPDVLRPFARGGRCPPAGRPRPDALGLKRRRDACQGAAAQVLCRPRQRWKTEIMKTADAPALDRTASAPPSADAWTAALPRADAPRTRLYSVRAEECGGEQSQNADDAPDAPLPALYLEAHWLRRHPRSLHRVLQAALPAKSAYLRAVRHAAPAPAVAPHSSQPIEVPMRHTRYVFRWFDWRPPTGGSGAATNGHSRFDVALHLCRVLTCAVDQCSRLDLRGAALAHVGHLEAALHRQERGAEPWNVQRLAAPVGVVLSYLRTLLSTLRWSPSADTSADGAATAAADTLPFWGVDEAASERVLTALLAAVRGWLRAGRHAAYPVARFLDGVPVAQVPWLRGFYTARGSSPSSPSAARHARRARSQTQQRTWMQFALFLTQDVLPFLVRAAFSVTWGSKNAHELLFFPTLVWRRLVRRELRRTRAGSGQVVSAVPGIAAECGGDDAHDSRAQQQDEAWRAVRTARQVSRRGARATLATRSGKPSCLYAGIRFRPDRRKLRPIAVVRSASLRSLREVARGSPSPYSRAARVVRLLDRLGGGRDETAPALPPTTATMLRWVQTRRERLRRQYRRQRRVRTASAPHAPHKGAMQDALRCLVSGVEAQRVCDGQPRLSNLSHQDEYAELRSFTEDVRASLGGQGSQEAWVMGARGAGPSPHSPTLCAAGVTLVRCDASRCYDSLPQGRVMAAVAALVPHDTYRVLRFTVLQALEREDLHKCAGAAELPTHALFRRSCVSRTVPSADVDEGRLVRIPRGHIYWEEEEESGLERGDGRGTRSRATRGISGPAVRALLCEHVQHHLVALQTGSAGGSSQLLEQHRGILQGSPVAMLLCDHLFASVVDVALSQVLGEHVERSLLLRRVDDVLVATASPVAAQRCLRAMQRGWPSVGYVSNPSKLTVASGSGALVPWCGLLLHDTTLEVSVEWGRISALLTSLRVGDPRLIHRGDREPLYFTLRFLAVLRLRVAPTALCRRLNSKARQLQTFYEVGLLWSRVVLAKVQEALPAAHTRTPAALLCRPLAACIVRLWQLLRGHQRFLAARQSACDVTEAEVQACVVTALHRTLQAKLRRLVARTAVAVLHHGRRRDRARRGSDRASVNRRGRAARRRGRRQRKHVLGSLRSFWWRAAADVEAQWRRCLHAARGQSCETAAAVDIVELLTDAGPASMHASALHATQL